MAFLAVIRLVWVSGEYVVVDEHLGEQVERFRGAEVRVISVDEGSPLLLLLAAVSRAYGVSELNSVGLSLILNFSR